MIKVTPYESRTRSNNNFTSLITPSQINRM